MLMAEETLTLVAEETLDVPVTPENIEFKGDHLRRNSSGNLDVPDNGVDVLPHYLRASVGSCHDFCKYGMKHICQTKSRIPMPKRITVTPFEGQDLARTEDFVQKNRTSVISPKSKSLPDSKSQIPDKMQVIKKEVSASAKKLVISSKETSLPTKGIDVSAKHAGNRKQQELSVLSPKPMPDSKSQIPHKQQVIKKVAPVSAKKVVISSKDVSSPCEGKDGTRKHASDPKHLPDSKSQIPDKKQGITKEVPAGAKKVAIFSKQVSSPCDGKLVSAKQSSNGMPKLPSKTKLSSLSIPGHVNTRRFSEIIIPKEMGAVKLSPVGGSNSRGNCNISKSKEVGMRKKNDLVPLTFSLSPKHSVKSVSNMKSGSHKIQTKVSHLKNQHTLGKDESEQPCEEKVPEKTLYVIEPEPENFTVELTRHDSYTTHSSPLLSPSFGDKSVGYDQISMHSSQFPSSENKNLGDTPDGIQSTRLSSSSSLSSEIRSLRFILNGTHDTQSSSSSSSFSSLSSSLSAFDYLQTFESSPIWELSGNESENQIANQKVEDKIRPGRVEGNSSENKDCSPERLNFRSRMLVDVQPENDSPSRLMYRQEKIQDENPNGNADTERRSLRRVVDEKLNETKPESEKVVLRHQDVEGKKDVQSLLNNVIEETASKLVQTRKSKVKALVGAFETVISLQDAKSSATTSAQ